MNIGIFDSGIGGVTLLHQAMVMMPHENFIFYADTAHVPYGTKTREQVISYADDAIHFLQSCGCKAVVIACNTATAAAAEQMRKKYTFPIIGIEPAVKPAVAESEGKRVMVVATPLAVQEEKLKSLVARVDNAHLVDLLALPRLVEFAERGEFVSDAVSAYLEEQFFGYSLDAYGELVLGCTHFNYFKDTFRKLMPEQVHIIDGSIGTIRQLARVLESKGLLAAPLSDESSEWKSGHGAANVKYYQSGVEVSGTDNLKDWDKLHERLEKMRFV